MTREEYLEYLRKHHEDRSEAEQAFHAAYNDTNPLIANNTLVVYEEIEG